MSAADELMVAKYRKYIAPEVAYRGEYKDRRVRFEDGEHDDDEDIVREELESMPISEKQISNAEMNRLMEETKHISFANVMRMMHDFKYNVNSIIKFCKSRKVPTFIAGKVEEVIFARSALAKRKTCVANEVPLYTQFFLTPNLPEESGDLVQYYQENKRAIPILRNVKFKKQGDPKQVAYVKNRQTSYLCEMSDDRRDLMEERRVTRYNEMVKRKEDKKNGIKPAPIPKEERPPKRQFVRVNMYSPEPAKPKSQKSRNAVPEVNEGASTSEPTVAEDVPTENQQGRNRKNARTSLTEVKKVNVRNQEIVPLKRGRGRPAKNPPAAELDVRSTNYKRVKTLYLKISTQVLLNISKRGRPPLKTGSSNSTNLQGVPSTRGRVRAARIILTGEKNVASGVAETHQGPSPKQGNTSSTKEAEKQTISEENVSKQTSEPTLKVVTSRSGRVIVAKNPLTGKRDISSAVTENKPAPTSSEPSISESSSSAVQIVPSKRGRKRAAKDSWAENEDSIAVNRPDPSPKKEKPASSKVDVPKETSLLNNGPSVSGSSSSSNLQDVPSISGQMRAVRSIMNSRRDAPKSIAETQPVPTSKKPETSSSKAEKQVVSKIDVPKQASLLNTEPSELAISSSTTRKSVPSAINRVSGKRDISQAVAAAANPFPIMIVRMPQLFPINGQSRVIRHVIRRKTPWTPTKNGTPSGSFQKMPQMTAPANKERPVGESQSSQSSNNDAPSTSSGSGSTRPSRGSSSASSSNKPGPSNGRQQHEPSPSPPPSQIVKKEEILDMEEEDDEDNDNDDIQCLTSPDVIEMVPPLRPKPEPLEQPTHLTRTVTKAKKEVKPSKRKPATKKARAAIRKVYADKKAKAIEQHKRKKLGVAEPDPVDELKQFMRDHRKS